MALSFNALQILDEFLNLDMDTKLFEVNLEAIEKRIKTDEEISNLMEHIEVFLLLIEVVRTRRQIDSLRTSIENTIQSMNRRR